MLGRWRVRAATCRRSYGIERFDRRGRRCRQRGPALGPTRLANATAHRALSMAHSLMIDHGGEQVAADFSGWVQAPSPPAAVTVA